MGNKHSEVHDFLNQLGELALGSRLKRLSERLTAQSAQIYQVFDMPMNPKWFPLIALLDAHEKVSVVEASEMLGISQPALSQFCKELTQRNLIRFVKSEEDQRRKLISLSHSGRKLLAQVKPTWLAVEQAAKQMCEAQGNDFYQAILNFEAAMEQESLLDRTMAFHPKTCSSRAYTPSEKNEKGADAIVFLDYHAELTHYFEAINKQWVQSMFVLEDVDKKVLGNPQKYIIDRGGFIYFAKHPKLGVVGACALMNSGQGNFELTKMGVLESARGLKVGELLLQHVLTQAKAIGYKKLYLLTNKACEAAIHLYEKNGFVHSQEIMDEYGSAYERCNVAMLYYEH